MNTQSETHVDLAEKAGFTAAAAEVKRLALRQSRLARAYEHYRFVPFEKIEAFRKALRESTSNLTAADRERIARHEGYTHETYDTLALTPIDKYPNIPPADVLMAAREAQSREIFDSMEVASIETTRETHDPLLFGVIDGCTDRFFLAQWGSDISITDLIGEHEG